MADAEPQAGESGRWFRPAKAEAGFLATPAGEQADIATPGAEPQVTEADASPAGAVATPGPAETGTAETGTAETGTAQTGTAKSGTDNSGTETGTAETSTAETSTAETSTAETSTAETSTAETDGNVKGATARLAGGARNGDGHFSARPRGRRRPGQAGTPPRPGGAAVAGGINARRPLHRPPPLSP